MSELWMPACQVPSLGAYGHAREEALTQSKRVGEEHHTICDPVLSRLQKLWDFVWVVGLGSVERHLLSCSSSSTPSWGGGPSIRPHLPPVCRQPLQVSPGPALNGWRKRALGPKGRNSEPTEWARVRTKEEGAPTSLLEQALLPTSQASPEPPARFPCCLYSDDTPTSSCSPRPSVGPGPLPAPTVPVCVLVSACHY